MQSLLTITASFYRTGFVVSLFPAEVCGDGVSLSLPNIIFFITDISSMAERQRSPSLLVF